MFDKLIKYRRTAYEILRVSPTATDEEIKKSFYDLEKKFNLGNFPREKYSELYRTRIENIRKLVHEAFTSLGGEEINGWTRRDYNQTLKDRDIAREQVNMPELENGEENKIISWATFTGDYSMEGVEGNLKPENFDTIKQPLIDGLNKAFLGDEPNNESFSLSYETKQPIDYGDIKKPGFIQLIGEKLESLTSPRRARERARNRDLKHGMQIVEENEARIKRIGASLRRNETDKVVDIGSYKKGEDGRWRERPTGIEDRDQVNAWKAGINEEPNSEVRVVTESKPNKPKNLYEGGITREEWNERKEIPRHSPIHRESSIEPGIGRNGYGYSSGSEGRKG